MPAVVLFGGYISPDVTGYDRHANLFTGGEACGRRTVCDHCRDAMNRITPDLVMRELDALLQRSAV